MKSLKNVLQDRKKRSYLITGALLFVFLTPILAAWSLYNSNGKYLASTVNYGHLIQPPLQIKGLPIAKPKGNLYSRKQLMSRWMIMFVEPRDCGAICRENLYKIRQVRRALGKDRQRVRLMLLSLSSRHQDNLQKMLKDGYPALMFGSVSRPKFKKFVQPLDSKGLVLQHGYLYVVDPMGNLMMSYPLDTTPKKIHSDLKRLLKVSNIG